MKDSKHLLTWGRNYDTMVDLCQHQLVFCTLRCILSILLQLSKFSFIHWSRVSFVTLHVYLLMTASLKQEVLLSQRGRTMLRVCIASIQNVERSLLLLVVSASDIPLHTIKFFSVVFSLAYSSIFFFFSYACH